MEKYIRIKITLLSFIILGAFASFAQNEWGNTIISYCQLLISITFAVEAFSILKSNIKNNNLKKFNVFVFASICFSSIPIIFLNSKRTYSSAEFFIALSFLMLPFILITIESIISYNRIRKSKPYFSGFFENCFLFLLFFSAFLKNSYLNMGPLFLFVSLLFLIPYIFIHSIQFFIKNKNKGLALSSLLAIGILTTALLGVSYFFKFNREVEVANILFIISMLFTFLMILGTLKWNYKFNNENINVLSALKLLRPNVVYIFFVAAIICSYNYCESLSLMPKFYSQHFPKKIEELNSEKKPDLEDRALDAKLAYEELIKNCEENGFLK